MPRNERYISTLPLYQQYRIHEILAKSFSNFISLLRILRMCKHVSAQIDCSLSTNIYSVFINIDNISFKVSFY